MNRFFYWPITLAASIVVITACDSPPDDALQTYALIVAEEDARGEQGWTATRSAITSDDATVRAWAYRALGRNEDPGLVSEISLGLRDSVATVRSTVVRAMAQAEHRQEADQSLHWLRTHLEGEADPMVLGAIAETLGRMQFPDDDQAWAETTLADLAVRSGQDEYTNAPEFAEGVARGLAATARRNRQTGGLSSDLQERAEELTSAHSGSEGAPIRRFATEALAVSGLTGSVLRTALEDTDPQIRRMAMSSVTQSGEDYSANIAAGLSDPSAIVRIESLRAFERWSRRPDGCSALFTASKDPVTAVSLGALSLLASPCPNETALQLELLTNALDVGGPESPQWHRPAQALLALAGLDPAAAQPFLASRSSHPSPFMRTWVARAAAEAGAATILEGLADDPNANVVTAAIQGLHRIVGNDAAEIVARQLDRDDPQLVSTAAGMLADMPNQAHTSPAMVAAMARFTELKRETSRDVRTALLQALNKLGTVEASELAAYATDFDPTVAVLFGELWGGAAGIPSEPMTLERTPTPSAERLAALTGGSVVIEMSGGGEMRIALLPELAATNADRFARLAEEGYFDGLTFHRIAPNFVIQGGSPHANEYMGDAMFSRDEISALSHGRGTVGLSTRGRDTGDAQIFVNLIDNARLDFDYTIYGNIVSGIDVMDSVVEGHVIARAWFISGR